MKVLVYGAGVLGSLYAVRLQGAGHRVAVLARGRRLADIERYGLVLEDSTSGRMTFAATATLDRLGPDDEYDLAIVPVRRTQVAGVLPALALNRRIPSVLFMTCNASGPGEMVEALGPDRVLLGYAGVAGVRVGARICCAQVPPWLQKTVIGEIDGRATPRIKEVRRAFRDAGFPTALSSNIDAWLKTHAAWVSPVAQSLYREDGNLVRLAARPGSLRLMVAAIQEGLAVLKALGVPPAGPLWVRAHAFLPGAALRGLWRRALRNPTVGTCLSGHAGSAREEMDRVSRDFRALVEKSGLRTPALDALAPLPGPGTP